jgi:transglutaminase-like putative cysteine protease
MGALDPLLTLLSFSNMAPEREGPAPYGVPVREVQIPTGDRGARKMVRVMADEARAAIRNPLTIRTVETITPPGANPADRIFFIREWLRERFIFSPDPHGIELLRTPDYSLNRILQEGETRGDCDDLAVLVAALGIAAGLPARFVLFAFGERLPFSHVFCELFAECTGWQEFDLTRPAQMPPGMKVKRAETHEV